MEHDCIQSDRLDRDEEVIKQHIHESSSVRERLTTVEAILKHNVDQVHDHKYNQATGWEPRMQKLERDMSSVIRLTEKLDDWMNETTRRKEWWESQFVGTMLQIFTLAFIGFMTAKGLLK